MARLWLPMAIMAGLCLPGPRALAGCFDFSHRIVQPAVDFQSFDYDSRGAVATASSELPDGTNWAAVHGLIRLPLPYLIQVIADHKAINDPRIDGMRIQRIEDPNGLLRQRLFFTSRPVPFVTVEWAEDWVFTVLSGTSETPQRVLVSFQKSSGTRHIQQLCGNILLERQDEHATQVYVYQPIKATHQTREVTLRGLEREFERLRRRSLSTGD